MATVADLPEETGLSIGGVLSRAFGVMGGNPIVIFGLSFLFGALPIQLYTYFLINAAGSPGLSPVTLGVVSTGSIVLFLLCSMLAQGAIIRASLAYAGGERASFGECIAVGLTKLLPLIGLSILLMLGIMAGFLLLFIPGVILLIMWSVAAPALVAEPVGILGAFGRSRYLTKGARWKIFGMLILMFVLLAVLSAVLNLSLYSLGVPTGQARWMDGAFPLWSIAISAVSNTITTAFSSTIVTGLYLSLRNWKDGPQAEALADIFA
ncbi:MAG TPA: hypothetical protein VF463_15630 [Sphingobium sp.]